MQETRRSTPETIQPHFDLEVSLGVDNLRDSRNSASEITNSNSHEIGPNTTEHISTTNGDVVVSVGDAASVLDSHQHPPDHHAVNKAMEETTNDPLEFVARRAA